MVRNPKIGQLVEQRYAESKRAGMNHGRRGRVVARPGQGSGPRNFLIEVAGGLQVVVPGGNLFAVKEQA